jgi:hypothetical protein
MDGNRGIGRSDRTGSNAYEGNYLKLFSGKIGLFDSIQSDSVFFFDIY